MKLLNLGCGSRFHRDWINIDFYSLDESILPYNLLQGIPFEDNCIDVVYHSHLLEHFTRKDSFVFLLECNRVLKPGGIIRTVVPDLELIAKEYLEKLNMALKNDTHAQMDYEWIILELLDQIVRVEPGGEMLNYLKQKDLTNKDYIVKRIGRLAEIIWNESSKDDGKYQSELSPKRQAMSEIVYFKKNIYNLKKYIKKIFFRKEILYYKEFKEESELGRFRLSGEIHQWMYDRYSLAKLMRDTGFANIEKKNAFESNILNWNKYNLDSVNDEPIKPDSLYMEAKKIQE